MAPRSQRFRDLSLTRPKNARNFVETRKTWAHGKAHLPCLRPGGPIQRIEIPDESLKTYGFTSTGERLGADR